MREILFRGKRLNNGEWVYGFYAHELRGEHYIHADEGAWYDGPMLTMVEVERETVGQDTGLDDKNGVNIFDGDICKMHYFFENYDGFGASEDEAEITCRITITPFGLRFEGEGMSGYLHEYVEEPGEELEVIGNTHDNPELLEDVE